MIKEILTSYIEQFNNYFCNNEELETQLLEAKNMVMLCNQIFLIGNGGEFCVAQHLAHDISKVCNIKARALTSPSYITALGNDCGYENIYVEWLKTFFGHKDLLIALSSSGQSRNIVNAALYIGKENTITLSSFEETNSLRKLGKINFYIPTMSYGVAECYHQIILHIILDSINGIE